MKILVYDIAAEDGGGLLVLKEFYRDVVRCAPQDIEWVFMTSVVELPETPHVRVLRYPQTKRSWLHRLTFEYGTLPGLIRKIAPDLVISLQNMPVRRCGVRQFVYLHQSLQFCPKRFSYFKREEQAMAVRQRIIGWFIKNAMPKAERIFVQTQWIREATQNWLGRSGTDITVVPVTIRRDVSVQKYRGQDAAVFFYPARAEMYKNHEVILEACRRLVRQGITDFEVIFTMKPGDSAMAARIFENAEGLPVSFIGTVPYEKIWDYYSTTVLLFPSYLETCGLPLLEARMTGARILASDLPFAHEGLDGYPNVRYFRHDDPAQLADSMKAVLQGRIPYTEPDDSRQDDRAGLMESMLRFI